MRLSRCTLLLLAVSLPAAAQEPTGPPPPTSNRVESGAGVYELLPDLGKIGSQVGLVGGASWNPYETGQGFHAAGFVDLPLARAPGGRLSYEILVGYSDAESRPFTITNPLAYVANLAAGADPAAALSGPPQAPFPVRREVTSRVRLLEVSPFGLKYTLTGLDRARLRPYFDAGLDFVVVISRQTPVSGASLEFTGTAPFDDPLIGGVVAQAPELTARGLPSGQGNMEIGFHAGGGVELRVSKGLSLNADYRFVGIDGTKARLHAVGAALGIHW